MRYCKHFLRVALSVAGVLALQTSDIQDFLHVVTSDRFHEPRRADAGMYGNFSANEFFEAKDHLLIENGFAFSFRSRIKYATLV